MDTTCHLDKSQSEQRKQSHSKFIILDWIQKENCCWEFWYSLYVILYFLWTIVASLNKDVSVFFLNILFFSS